LLVAHQLADPSAEDDQDLMKSMRSFCLVGLLIAVLWGMNLASQTRSLTIFPADERRFLDSLPLVLPGLNGAYALDVEFSKRVSAVYTYAIQAPKFAAREWVLFMPEPPELPSQNITGARTVPAGTIVRDLSPRQQRIFRTRVPANTESLRQGIVFQLIIDADLYSRILVPATNNPMNVRAGRLSDDERLWSLLPTPSFDYSSKPVHAWAVKSGVGNRETDEGEIAFARRVFQAVARGFQYEYRENQNRSASQVCLAGRSDCLGLCNLFVAVLRSQGIPARTLVGRWAVSARPGEKIGDVINVQQHVKAEFFAQGVGWVPVDPSLAVQRDMSQQRLLHFGNDPGDFVTLHLDSEVTFNTIYFGTITKTLQKARYFAIGDGSLGGAIIREDWAVNWIW
jgi:transglutaminase-like putative cysteine protease